MERNFEGLAAAYNMLRLKVGNETLSYKELYEQLRKVGISSGIVQKMITHGYIKSERDPSSKTNKYSLTIVNKIQIENLFKERRKDSKRWSKKHKEQEEQEETNSLSNTIKSLKDQGFVVMKKEFNMEGFKKAYPAIYEKFLVLKAVE